MVPTPSRRALLAGAGAGLSSLLASCTTPDSRTTRLEDGERVTDYTMEMTRSQTDRSPVVAPTAESGSTGDGDRTATASDPLGPHTVRSERAAAGQEISSDANNSAAFADSDLSRIPNEVVPHRLEGGRESARSGLGQEQDGDESRFEVGASLAHPRSETMFVNAGAAAFDGELTEADVSVHRSRHHSDAEAFVADHRYVGPPDDPVGTLTMSVHIADWGHAGVRLTEREQLYDRYAAANRLADAALAVVRRVGDALQA